ncbi:helix-turn-helix domain-containing protein [Empedobacter tilapiae]|uniref:AraC family transcriptional regulator n=1 Tax=Empedobacter tilapiae TaxID=2491114 RepID=A0A4Z1AXL1_9FLAO|nr:AraC family transcriptional regulator [Empedobacter tilapiae]TGN21946.1 AraC family transcriptional regulator [Empedobacter tilapiae]
MALFITLDNVYSLYNLDTTSRIEGIVVFHQHNKANQNYKKHSRLFEGLLIGVVLKGSMKTQIHFSEYEVQEGDIAIVPPQIMIETKSLSEDAEIVTIGLSLDFISTFPILREFVMNDQIRWQPIIRLDQEELLLQEELIKLIEKVYDKKQSSHKTEMLKHLVMSLIHLITEKYQNVPSLKNQTKNRTHEIIDNFYSLVSKYAHKQRNVQFYADKLHLSTQYLSSFLKQNTGKSTLQWIDYVLVLHAKTLLKSSNLSIKEISNELEFTDTSVFCRYFKRNTGISPKLYREEE